ncbi:MAG TPA: SGNH/GDSL hydrolase family protein [Pyrinomonadaceae bacterium]|nr:SGNH/GDSL hydrolase family protein [Pyrinomonadaceae bacterium]
MGHAILLGDSIFDNAAYVGASDPDVVRQTQEQLPRGWQATLLAVDGSVIRGVRAQAEKIPADASHLVLSVGGNDALGQVRLLEAPARSMAEALTMLARTGDDFEREYQLMLDALLARRLPTALCTIYNPRFADPQMQKLAVTALCIFNDAITRAAFARGLPLLDLRLICDDERDYANPIEPSARGGAKIAAAIKRAVTEHDFSRGRTEVFV